MHIMVNEKKMTQKLFFISNAKSRNAYVVYKIIQKNWKKNMINIRFPEKNGKKVHVGDDVPKMESNFVKQRRLWDTFCR